jgi:arylsulfatase A-like enzyme
MEASGQWDKTWVILSADHSWRESKLYDGQRDFRVPYLIKPPGATVSAEYTRPFNTVLTHDLILAILRGELTDGQSIAPWLDAHAEPSSPIIGQGVD